MYLLFVFNIYTQNNYTIISYIWPTYIPSLIFITKTERKRHIKMKRENHVNVFLKCFQRPLQAIGVCNAKKNKNAQKIKTRNQTN